MPDSDRRRGNIASRRSRHYKPSDSLLDRTNTLLIQLGSHNRERL